MHETQPGAIESLSEVIESPSECTNIKTRDFR